MKLTSKAVVLGMVLCVCGTIWATPPDVMLIVDVVAIAKDIPITTAAPALTTTYPTTFYSPAIPPLAPGQTITSFDYSPNFMDGTYSELWVSPANLALIPAGTSVVFTGNVVANAIGGYDAVVSAYNTTDTTTPIFSQQFPSIDVYSGDTTDTGTKISAGTTAQPNTRGDTWIVYTLNDGSGNTFNNGTSYGAQFTAPASSTISFQPITSGTAFNTVVAPAGATPIVQIVMSPIWGNVAGDFAECGLSADRIAAINTALASGTSVNIASTFVPSATKTGSSDFVVAAYNATTQKMIGDQQVFPAITQTSNVKGWKYSNITYQLNTTPASAAVIIGNILANQAFGITSAPAQTEYQAFIAQIPGLSSVNVSGTKLTAQNYPSSAVTIGGYSFFGPAPTSTITAFNTFMGPSGTYSLAPYVANATTPSVTAILLEFDDSTNPKPRLSLVTAVKTDTIYLFLFDTATGKSLVSGAGIKVAEYQPATSTTAAATITPLATPYTVQVVGSAAAQTVTYPAAFILTA